MDWIHLSQDRDQWRALVYTVTNFRLRDFSPQANYTDRATAACRRSLGPHKIVGTIFNSWATDVFVETIPR
jgi:hypothetical protein